MRAIVGLVAASATVLGVSVVGPQAMAATTGSYRQVRTSAAPVASSQAIPAAARRPFRIQAGKLYDVTATVTGARAGWRNALEVYYRHRWHVIGSWKLHRGSYHFRGAARTSHPGLYTLRLQFLNKRHQLIKGTQSNSFQVRVLGFRVPRQHRPGQSARGIKPDIRLTDWTDIQCAQTLPGLGHGIFIPSPVQRVTGTGEVNQVVWVRDALPGGNFGSWYIATSDEQYIHPADPGIITITGAGDIKDSSYLDDEYVTYPAVTEYHEVAWDLQIQGSDGLWRYISSSWYTPGSYIQWASNGQDSSQSSYCLTYQTAGN